MVVLDTNVVVSGFLSPHGPPGRIMDLLLARQFRLAWDDRLSDEYSEVLSRPKFGFDPRLLDAFFAIFPFQEKVVALPWQGEASPDADDTMLLEIALAAGAPLVTGNLRHFPPSCRGAVAVLTPHEWLTAMSG